MIVSTFSSWEPQSLPLGVQLRSSSSLSAAVSVGVSSVAGAEDLRRRFCSVGSAEAEVSLASPIDLRLRPGPGLGPGLGLGLGPGFAAFFLGRPPIFL